MSSQRYTIGEAARLCGVSVRKLRFYSDAKLIPPAGRSNGGYRLYTEADLLRLDLILALREAGLGLEAIRQVLSRSRSLGEALELRLAELERELAAKRRVAAAIRSALRNGEPSEDDLRRVWAITKISRDERREVIAQFYEQVARGTQMDPAWKHAMIEASTPELPAEPTPEQIDAWIELCAIVRDPSFVTAMQAKAAVEWHEDVDHAAHVEVLRDVLRKVSAAIEAGHAPESDQGRAIARDWLASSARLLGRDVDEPFKAYWRSTFAVRDPRKSRYWELVAILRGEPAATSPNREWQWIIEAMRHCLG